MVSIYHWYPRCYDKHNTEYMKGNHRVSQYCKYNKTLQMYKSNHQIMLFFIHCTVLVYVSGRRSDAHLSMHWIYPLDFPSLLSVLHCLLGMSLPYIPFLKTTLQHYSTILHARKRREKSHHPVYLFSRPSSFCVDIPPEHAKKERSTRRRPRSWQAIIGIRPNSTS